MKKLSIYSQNKSYVCDCFPIDFEVTNERSSSGRKICEISVKFQGVPKLSNGKKHTLYFKLYAVLELLMEIENVNLIKYKLSHVQTTKERPGFNKFKIMYFLNKNAAESIFLSLELNKIFADPFVEECDLLEYLIMMNNGKLDSLENHMPNQNTNS
jgi:hypothetical protein